ncbi:MFS transporter [Rhodovastum atsumiense]|uniref:MFS transporter n=1 Tax=Rhodovastum atsumiense TaxID=504468 RepID=A0A5M6ISR5_9PROT|nr:MFS transporter [Rhodovastum atsumiense]KAA5610887.1 MFS transporter [Rhodovastum atsumiense]CAH2601548.1 MFS transporter [Rhodovastum atsumiense]
MLSRDTRVNTLIGTGHFLSHFYVLCLPPMFIYWRPAFDVGYAQLGLAVTLMSGITAVLQTPVGFLVDRYGARRFLVGGTLLMTLTIAAMGFATAYWQILVLAALSGVGNSVIHPADYAILTGSVSKDRMGSAFGLHTFNGNLGFALGPPVIIALAEAIGWRGALMVVGLLGIPLVVTILLQSRFLVDQVRPHDDAPAMSGRELLLSRTMLLFFGFFMLGSMAGAGIQAWIITILHQTRGMDLALASTALTGYMIGATGGTLIGGYAADRIKRHLTFAAVLTTVSAVLVLAIAVLRLPDAVILALLFVSGIALGASRTPRDIMVKDAAPPGQIGKVFGFVSAGLPLGAAVTPAPFGFLIDQGYPMGVLVLVSVLLMLSILCGGTARAQAPVRAVPAPAE